MIGLWLLTGCPVGSWNAQVVPDTGEKHSTETGMQTDTALEHTSPTGDTAMVGHTSDTSEVDETSDTGGPTIECPGLLVAGASTLTSLTTLTPLFSLYGQVSDIGDTNGDGATTLAYLNGYEIVQRDIKSGIAVPQPFPLSYIQWVQAIPDADNDGQSDLLLNEYTSLVAVSSATGDRIWERTFWSQCRPEGFDEYPSNAVLVAPGLFGNGADVDILLGCALDSGTNVVMQAQYDSVTPPSEPIDSELYTIDALFSGHAGSHPGTMAAYNANEGIWLGDQGDGSDPSKVFLLPHQNSGSLTVGAQGDVRWIVEGDLTSSDQAVAYHPRLLSEDFDHDGEQDLIVAMSVDTSGTPNDPVQIAIFTDVVSHLGGAPTTADQATILLSAGTDYASINGPIRWLDQPGEDNDFLLVRVTQNNGNGAVVWVPSNLTSGTRSLKSVEHGVVLGQSPQFGDWLPTTGDVDGDGCNDIVIQEGAKYPTFFGEGTAYVLSGI